MTASTLRAALLGTAALGLAACGSDREEVAVTTTDTSTVRTAENCVAVTPVYATVERGRFITFDTPKGYGNREAFVDRNETGWPAVPRDQANAVAYTVVDRNGERFEIVTTDEIARGETVYIESDSCGEARYNVISEAG